MKTLSASITVLLLLVAAGCSDDAPAADSGPAREAGAEAAPPSDGGSDGDVWTGGDAGPAPDPNMLPGCAAACGADQVCKAGACVDLPTTACGSDKWGGALGGNVLYVDAAYAQSDSNGSEQKPYQSIADALSKLPGDDYTIVVTDGTYDAGGPLLITRPVILRCRCPDKVRIASPVVVTRTASSPAAPVQVQIVGCTIAPGASAPSAAPSCGGTNNDEPRGVTVTQPQSGQPVQLSLRDETRVFGWCTGVAMIGADAADALCLSGARVTHNVRGVDASKAAASLSAALPGCTFKHGVSIEDSRIANNTDYGVFTRQGATTLGCKSSLIERNGTLAQNVKAGLGYGLYHGGVTAAEIDSCRVRSNENRGAVFSNAHTTSQVTGAITITSSVFDDNGGAGLVLSDLSLSGGVKLDNSRAYGTRALGGADDADGVQVAVGGGVAHSIDITGSRIDSNARTGVLMDGPLSGSVASSVIARNATYGCLFQKTGRNVALSNNSYAQNPSGNWSFEDGNPLQKIATLPIPLP